MKYFHQRMALASLLLILFVSGCGSVEIPSGEDNHEGTEMPELPAATLGAGDKLNVVATTSIVADVVRQVGGDNLSLRTLIPPGADPHAFEPTPRDIAAVADAHVVFASGLGLEDFLETVIVNAGGHTPVVPVSFGMTAEKSGQHVEDVDLNPSNAGDELGHEHASEGVDPHTWFDPNNVIVWVRHILSALQALDPDNASWYARRAEAYQRELEALDAWIVEQVNQIPEANRKLVTDHEVFRYFAVRYGFEQIGTVVPGYNAAAQPSAQALAELERNIETYKVQAIFVGTTVNPDLAQQIARDVGVQLVVLYTGSLSEPDGDAGSYINFMRYNTQAIVESLK
ncbi:MAG: metal ABC transporter substrate-binding protein [Anaerolineae bacterium]|nr:metal ABC transporter substrate-binding protein [Anaerolineae bacterium]